jgi:hypothetical protein
MWYVRFAIAVVIATWTLCWEWVTTGHDPRWKDRKWQMNDPEAFRGIVVYALLGFIAAGPIAIITFVFTWIVCPK